MAQDFLRISERNFILGYNDKDKPENIRYSQNKIYMADILNGFVEENKIIKRYGYSSIGNAPVNKPILGQKRHEPAGGTKYILRARNTADNANSVVEGWSGSGNFATLTGATTQTASLEHEFVTAANATYIFNGTDTVLKTTNGTSTSTVAGIPKGKGGKWWHNFLFVYGESTKKSRLYISNINTPETFDGTTGYIDVNADDGEEIIQIAALKDELIIFKQTKVFLLTGYGSTNFTLSNLSDFANGVGTIAPRSVVETGNDVYYLSFQGSVPHIRSIYRTQYGSLSDRGIISDAITGTMKRLVISRLNQTAGIYDGRKVWYSICTSGTTNNEVIVYDTLTEGWTRHTGINASVFNLSTISGSLALYFGSSTSNGLSYQLDKSTNDNGTAIDFQVITPAYSPQPGHKSKYKYLYITADVTSNVNVDVEYSPDGFTYENLGTFSLTGQGAAFGTAIFGTSKFGATTTARDRLDWAGGVAYFMQYKFKNNVLDDEVSLREWELFYKPKSLRSI